MSSIENLVQTANDFDNGLDVQVDAYEDAIDQIAALADEGDPVAVAYMAKFM